VPRSLYARLALVLLLLLASVGLLQVTLTFSTTQAFLDELTQRFNQDLARELLVRRAMPDDRPLEHDEAVALFTHYMHINPAIEIYLLDAEGKILAFEAPQKRIKRERVDVGPIRDFLAERPMLPILGDDPRHTERRKSFSAAAIPRKGPTAQYLYVILGGEAWDDVAHLMTGSWFYRTTTLTLLIGLGVSLLAGLSLFALLTRRLRRLDRRMGAFEEADFRRFTPCAERRPEHARDEIDRLGHTFDAMAARIIEQMAALERKETLRRNLVANVSHDLRTPITALQGYLESLLLKRQQLADDELERRLAVAFRQSQRLGELVGELFQLAKLEARESVAQREPLLLPELAQDVLAKFLPEIENRGVRLDFHVVPGLPVTLGDPALLDRLFDNLLRNALDHLPDGGQLQLDFYPEGGRVVSAIANDGANIPAEQLEHLFERFYQAPERRGGGGAGLGLAIVRNIVELHGGEISVTSSADELTRFQIRWPAVN